MTAEPIAVEVTVRDGRMGVEMSTEGLVEWLQALRAEGVDFSVTIAIGEGG